MIGVEQFIGNIEVYLQGNRWLAVAAVFTGGALSAAAPCVLIMIPLMMSYVAGRDDRGGGALRAFGLSLLFVVGMSITFTAFGFVAALAGKLYGDIPGWWNFVVALVSLEFNHHESTTGAILGEDVERPQRTTMDLSVKILKPIGPRQRIPLLGQEIFEILLQRHSQIQRLGRNIPRHGRGHDMLPLLQMVEQQRQASSGPMGQFLDSSRILDREDRILPVPPLVLKPHGLVIDSDVAATAGGV